MIASLKASGVAVIYITHKMDEVFRIADKVTVFADTKETAVNALAVDKSGTVFAATTSNKVYRE